MKTWKNAELVEVSIANTANGFVPFYIEGKYEWLFNDDLAIPENFCRDIVFQIQRH